MLCASVIRLGVCALSVYQKNKTRKKDERSGNNTVLMSERELKGGNEIEL